MRKKKGKEKLKNQALVQVKQSIQNKAVKTKYIYTINTKQSLKDKIYLYSTKV